VSASLRIGKNRGTLPLTSPRKGTKLLEDKSKVPTGSDCPLFSPILREATGLALRGE